MGEEKQRGQDPGGDRGVETPNPRGDRGQGWGQGMRMGMGDEDGAERPQHRVCSAAGTV